MKKTVLALRCIDKWFHDQQVLDHIDFDVNEGEFLTLLGPSGCGKSTLLRLIAGFDVPTSGQILINGKDVSRVPPNHRHVNMVFQNYALFPHMTVFENIAFGLRCQRLPSADIQDRVDRVLQMVKLENLKARKPHQLSGGQQQRVAIARAAVNEPLVLLLDEPMSALDHALRKNMQLELKTLQRRLGLTFVMVTHNQEEALSMSDRVVVMSHGKVEQIGPPRVIYEHPNNLYVAQFIGETNVFETEVLAVDGNNVTVNIEDHQFVFKTRVALELHQKISVLLRPEDLRSWDNSEVDDTKDMISAVVEQVVYKGSIVDLVLRTDKGTKLSATQFFDEDDENLDFRLGEHVWVEWPFGWEIILPHEA
ncbi:MAG: spermidine/putrescine ABC transporter ATP-binding protein PotA [Pseudomonadota bacterium]